MERNIPKSFSFPPEACDIGITLSWQPNGAFTFRMKVREKTGSRPAAHPLIHSTRSGVRVSGVLLGDSYRGAGDYINRASTSATLAVATGYVVGIVIDGVRHLERHAAAVHIVASCGDGALGRE